MTSSIYSEIIKQQELKEADQAQRPDDGAETTYNGLPVKHCLIPVVTSNSLS